MLKAELEKLELPLLREMYLTENNKLQAALLEGILWTDLTEQRKMVVTIGVVIDAKVARERNLM